ncbi:flavodoxin family protein [Gemella cuniculi]|uniref:flavodoxin family protein n=1 Tax=Gemella cuniculi TaxID=150240 RepID=UPI00041C2D6D|nr:NAD(P)H-dependent oxidoreductase [Gemella cuniculi]
MKKIMIAVIILLLTVVLIVKVQQNNKTNTSISQISQDKKEVLQLKTKTVFINGSQHVGNTVRMGNELLENVPHDQLNLIDYKIGFLGQNLSDDEFSTFIETIKQADTLVIGTPVYWHSMSATLKNFIERSSELTRDNPLRGKKLYFFMQGANPTEISKESTVYIIERFANQLGLELRATATDNTELEKMKTKLESE